jgi:uncharacterized Zn finger protein
VTVAERRAQAEQRLAELRKRGQEINPVVIRGRAIATTFWGKAWCQNLESYGDFANRLPRGRTYARNGSVVDLQIEPGRLRALVSGSSLYTAEVEIRPMEADRWKRLAGECAGKIDSVVELLSGRLSEGVMEILCGRERGLFPSTQEISLSCSCPDGARLCKHLAAVLYGVGARLDHQPELLFVLRGVDQVDLVSRATNAVGRADAGGGLEGESLSELFGIEIETEPVAAPSNKVKRVPKAKKPARGRPVEPVITREELRARGVPAKDVLRWLRLGVLLYTKQRGAYLKTRETEKRIAELKER